MKQRLLSLDALRGFDMLLIAGGGAFIVDLKGVTNLSWLNWMADQLTHPAWNGFTFYDCIFPLFLFIAGVSLAISLSHAKQNGIPNKVLYKKAWKRWLILFLLGVWDKNIPLNIFDPGTIRYGTVLGRIGLATLITTYLYIHFNSRQLFYWVAGILTAYFLMLKLIPVPGYGAGDLSFEGNLVGWFDRTFMPGRLLQGTYDENALLTQLPAHCLTVLGALAGNLLLSSKKSSNKMAMLVGAGILGIGIGVIWGTVFPVNKHLWSSSFILLTAGMSSLFLALFYGIIDVLKFTKWAFFFKVIGMNALVVYLAYRFINFNYTSKLLFEGFYMHAPEPWHSALNSIGALLLVWLMLYFLYKKKIFVRI